ncbi:MAG: hypothetical protein M3Y50_15175 [Acidobacteriota bacterium]|nr:hypothetical protein [Acidobacteriota bacterium]
MPDPLAMQSVTYSPLANGLQTGTANTIAISLSTVGTVVDPGGSASISVSFDAYLSEKAWAHAIISAPGFKTKQTVVAQVPTWELSPEGFTPSTLPATLVVTFSNLTPPGDASVTRTVLTTSWHGLVDDKKRPLPDGAIPTCVELYPGSPTGQTLPPSSFSWLSNSDIPHVLISTGECPPIENALVFSISNLSETAPLVPSGGTKARFVFTLASVPSESSPGADDAVCTSAEVEAITASFTPGKTSFEMGAHPDVSLQWTLHPLSDHIFEAQDSVTVSLAGLETYLPPNGMSFLFIDWRNVPGYADGSQTMKLERKTAQPTILPYPSWSSEHHAEFVAAGEKITISWETYGVRIENPVSVIALNGGTLAPACPAVGTFSFHPNKTDHYRIALNAAQVQYSKWMEVPIAHPSVQLSVVTPRPWPMGSPIELRADIRYVGSYELDPGVYPSTQVSGSTLLSPAVRPDGFTTYTLTGTGSPGVASVSAVDVYPSVPLESDLLVVKSDGIYRMNRAFNMHCLVPLDGSKVTSVNMSGTGLGWGMVDQNKYFWAQPDGSGQGSFAVGGVVLGCSQAYCGSFLLLAGGAILYVQIDRTPPEAVPVLFSLPGCNSSSRFFDLPSERTAFNGSNGVSLFDLQSGAPFDAGIPGPVVGYAHVESDTVMNDFWLDGKNLYLSSYGDPAQILCSAQPTERSSLILDPGGDVYWLEAGNGRSELWRYDSVAKQRKLAWATQEACYAMGSLILPSRSK